ncbi:hypothetical protein NDU88_002556 [Pleurodeles waltl]|uniref:Uncharacterized protein n=1 Tax=Pleurodeles waltl TaxID=8319 RepID=A0AAV7QD10_PLEWA|nr:hypothetical protein NDU88_002556 [Pleurodeles waltl]
MVTAQRRGCTVVRKVPWLKRVTQDDRPVSEESEDDCEAGGGSPVTHSLYGVDSYVVPEESLLGKGGDALSPENTTERQLPSAKSISRGDPGESWS